jgi:hypothetical protein
MTPEEFSAWLVAHGGEHARQPVNLPGGGSDDPYSSGSSGTTATKVTARDGSTVTLVRTNADDGLGPVPAYQVVAQSGPKQDTTAERTPTQAAQDSLATELDRQRKTNAAAGRGYYTDEQVEERQRQQATQDRQTEQQREANRLAQARLDADANARALDDQRADSAEARAQQAANRPTIVNASPAARRIAQMGPDGTITSVDNPNYDSSIVAREEAKARAAAERDRLALQIEAGKLTEASAASAYKRWFDENVTLPMQRAQEARARAAEIRAAQQAEDARKQFAANYEKDRQTTALGTGQQMASNFNQNLQYRVGPAFGEQFAKALDSFQPGAPPAHFTADAFTFKGPSIEEVARKATAQALSTISPYAKAMATAGDRPLQVASYDQSMEMANMGGGGPAPAAVTPDYSGMIQGYLDSNPYVPGYDEE